MRHACFAPVAASSLATPKGEPLLTSFGTQPTYSLPTRKEFEMILVPLGLDVTTYRDEPKLYLMVAKRCNEVEQRLV